MGGVPASLTPSALLRKRETLQIDGRQKGLAWKAVAQPHLPMALRTPRHRDCLLVLPAQTSNVYLGVPARIPPATLLRKCERLQIACSQKGLAWKAVAQPHLPMALLAQRHRDWGCLLVLPPETSNTAWEWGGPCQAPYCSPAPKMRTAADSWQPEGVSLESCSNSLICPWHCAHRGTETEASFLSCHLKFQT